MDPIESIEIRKDTTFAVMLEAQRRGYEIHYMQIKDLFLRDGIAFADTKVISLKEDVKCWFNTIYEQPIKLSYLDAVLIRKDPPFDKNYLYATYVLERSEEEGTFVVNRPQSLRDCNEKMFTAGWFGSLTPKTLVTGKASKIRAFLKENGEAILKPLDGMGGESIFHVKDGEPNLSVVVEILTNHGKEYCVAQKFMPEISAGDKRIIVIDGEPIPYCLARIPTEGEVRGNLAAGGRGRAVPLSETDEKIVKAVSPVLRKKGLFFVGLDVIGDKLTEINVTSPTCVREIEAAFDISITGQLMDAIENAVARVSCSKHYMHREE